MLVRGILHQGYISTTYILYSTPMYISETIYVKDVDTDVTKKNMQVDTHVKTANTDVMTKTCTWAP